MLKPQHCTWYEIKPTPLPRECIYSIFIWLYTAWQSDRWLGGGRERRVGRGGRGPRGRTHLLSWVQGHHPLAPHPLCELQREGGEQEGGRWGNQRPKAGPVLYTSKAYISSEQNDSFYFYARVWGWMRIVEASLVTWRDTHRPGGRPALDEAAARRPRGPCVVR